MGSASHKQDPERGHPSRALTPSDGSEAMDALGWLMTAAFGVGFLVGAVVLDAYYKRRWRDLSHFFQHRAKRERAT